MKHMSKGSKCFCAAISTGLLLLTGIASNADRGASPDPFSGDWLLSVHSAPGQEVSSYEMTVALKISRKGNFYGVTLEIPTAYPETGYGGFSWPKFVAQSGKALKNMSAGKAKSRYTGDYLLDVDGGAITHQNGTVTFAYKAQNRLLCEAGLGCFRKGNQAALLKSYRERKQDKVKADARADAEARVRAKADAEARAEAKARSDAEARKPRIAIDTNFTVAPREDTVFSLETAYKTRLNFEIVVQRLDMDRMGRGNAVRVILLDEDGYAEWGSLQYKMSLASILGRSVKKTETITGPCPALLKRDVQGPDFPPYTDGRVVDDCVLDAGKYFIVFYDGYPGFRVQGDQINFSASLRVITQIVGRIANPGEAEEGASAEGADEALQPALSDKYQASRTFENGVSAAQVLSALHAYEVSEEGKGQVQLLNMNEAQGRISWVQTIGDTGKTVTTKVRVESLESGIKVTVTLLGSQGLKIKKTSANREMGILFAEIDKAAQ